MCQPTEIIRRDIPANIQNNTGTSKNHPTQNRHAPLIERPGSPNYPLTANHAENPQESKEKAKNNHRQD